MSTKHTWHHPVLPWLVWGIAASYFFYDYLQQMVPGVIGPALIQAFHVQAAALGILSAFYFYSYSIMQIPVGLIVDHFGPHRPLVIAALVAAGANLLFSMATTLTGGEFTRLLVGAGAAFSYVSCLKLVSNWFSAGRFATLAGMTSMLGMVGAIIGGAPLADVVSHLGWRGTVVALAVLGVVMAVLILLVVRDHPRDAVRWHEHPENARGVAKTWSDLKHVFGMGQFWIVGVWVTTMNISFTAFGAVWGTSYLQKVYHIDKIGAAAAVSMMFVGAIAGGIFFGWLSDHIRRRKLLMLMGSISGLIVMSTLLYFPGLSLSATYVLLLVLGFSCNGLILGYAVGHDIRPPGSAGAAVGFVNTCCAGGTSIFLPIIGWLSDYSSSGKHTLGGIAALSVKDFRFALSFLIVCLAVAVLLGFFCRETHCQELYN